VALSWLRVSFQGIGSDANFWVDPADDRKFSSDTNQVTPGFFDAIGLPIVAGRDFASSESGLTAEKSCACVLMTESLARRVFGSQNAAGRQIFMNAEKKPTTIVGIVRDTRQRFLTTPAPDMIFLPFRPTTASNWTTVVVGLSGPADAVAPLIRRAVEAVDPTLPIYDLLRGDEGIRRQFAEEDLLMRLALVFAALSCAVAGIGLFGVLSRTIAERRRELAIRAALGATPRGLAGLLLAESAAILGAGATAGLAVSWWLSSYLTSRLFGVTPHDTFSFVIGTAIVTGVLIAVIVPAAVRAGRSDPLSAIRA
jgi:ABC-type antimicrobial peptide transport system permease subunit